MDIHTLSSRRTENIVRAIEAAQRYAEEQGVPLTAERLAAQLDMDIELFRDIVEGRYPVSGKKTQEKADIIRHAAREATASVVEHAMRRGSSTNMHLLYLKNNAGYEREREQDGEKGAAQMTPVIFVGEEDILD